MLHKIIIRALFLLSFVAIVGVHVAIAQQIKPGGTSQKKAACRACHVNCNQQYVLYLDVVCGPLEGNEKEICEGILYDILLECKATCVCD